MAEICEIAMMGILTVIRYISDRKRVGSQF